MEAKLFEQGVRKERDNATWANVFAELPRRSIFPNKGDDGIGVEVTFYFAKMTGETIRRTLSYEQHGYLVTTHAKKTFHTSWRRDEP